MAEKGHFGAVELDDLHTKHRQKNSTEGGACLTGHEPNFGGKRNKVSCNYRWQAYEQAQAHGGIEKALHSYKTATDIKPQEPTSSWKEIKPEYCAMLPAPQAGDWDITGPTRDLTRANFAGTGRKIPQGMNFTKELWPYWNNAHHLIPKGTLKAKIVDAGEPATGLIQKALMTAQYNINHKINMLFMPQDKRVADILGLPRHIQLRDADSPGMSASCGNHPDYNRMTCTMERGLDSIIKGYIKICDKAVDETQGTHDVPNPTLDKKKLEELSKELLDIILGATAAGDVKAGQSLDHLAKARGA